MDRMSPWLLEFITNIFTNNPHTLSCREAIRTRIHLELAKPINDILTSLEQSGVIKTVKSTNEPDGIFYALAPDCGGSAEDIREFAQRLEMINNCHKTPA